MKITRSELVKIANEETREWVHVPRGLLLAIYFAFIHRLTTGETVEQTFFTRKQPESDYSI